MIALTVLMTIYAVTIVSATVVLSSNLSGVKKERRNIIALLLPDVAFDLTPTTELIAGIDKNFQDNHEADLVIFHEGYPFADGMKYVRGATKRNVDFVNVDSIFNQHPPNFDPYQTDPNWWKRKKWGYHQMIKFWFSDIFTLSVMDNVDIFFRIDDDSCFLAPFGNLFKVMQDLNCKCRYIYII